MRNHDCNLTRVRLEDRLDGYLDAGDAAAVDTHLACCEACAAYRDALVELRAALKRMPVAPLRHGFTDTVLAAAVRGAAVAAARPAASARRLRPSRAWRRLELWAGAALGAAATLAMVAVLWGPPRSGAPEEAPADVRLVLNETRDVTLLIEAQRAMPAARLTVRVDGGIALAGFDAQRELSWDADLEAGTNVLSLPIVARSLEAGTLSALVEHGAKTRRVAVSVRVEPPRG
jgi:anti-sigma factor RsiW